MSVTLVDGLADLSRELGESSTDTSTKRINYYNDAVQRFFNERKWPFALISDISQTSVSGTQTYKVPSDCRKPGGIKYIQYDDAEYKPVPYHERDNDKYDGGNWFYYSPDFSTFTFLKDITDDGKTITIWYYAVPERQTDTSTGEFTLLPDRYRQAVAFLAAAFVLWGRHMNTDANNKYSLYVQQIKDITLQQSERPNNLPRTFGHYLKHVNWRRKYP